ncbi:hypothetical protein OPQ81_005572 [Rhizoctonia solani]|nr:hypothetical protein OPQ81_005572 [Rhizoctonia solani]
MSESIGKPWIQSSVVEILVDHAHELPSPPDLHGRAQIVRFLTFREDTGDGSQPRDRDTVLWAEITDGEWIIPVRIGNEATNKIEDEYKRALTYYRRGFFTLKAAVSFDFILTQVGKTQARSSSLKQIFLDIVELRYISGGGEGAPVATRAVALQTPPEFNKWVSALNTGGQILINLQAQERVAKSVIRVSKTNSRRSNATGASKRLSKGPIKTSAHPVTPQSSIGNLAAKREWQEGWFGKRPKFHGVDYVPRSDGFEPTADQQAKFKAILERVKLATPTHPYDPTDVNSNSSVPNRPSVPSALPSSQAIRPSQVISSTPIDTRPPRSNTMEPLLRISEAVHEPVNSSSDVESNGDSDSDHDTSVWRQQAKKPATNQTNRVGHQRCHIPTPRPSDPRADESHEEVSGETEHGSQSLEADDAVTEQILSQAELFASDGQRNGMPTVPVPDSDPPNLSQRATQVRHSSPWDCESGPPSERDISHSPEATRRPTKGKQRLSPTLSSPPRSVHDEIMSSQPVGHVTSNAKQQSISGSEDSNGPKANVHHLEYVLSRRADETTSLAPNLPHPRETSLQRDLKNDLSEQREEAFETRPSVDKLTSRKRRLSQSQDDDTPHAQLPQELASSVSGKPITENKRRRLDDSNSKVPIPASKKAPRQPNVAREDPVNEPMVSSNTTKPVALNGAGIIPHDHDAWVNPSWMNAPNPKQLKPTSPKASRTSNVSIPDKPHARRISRPSTGLRILHPPFDHPARIVKRAPSPGFPPVTASQFADADEDFGVANSKVGPPAPAQPMHKPIASKPRTISLAQPKLISREQPGASLLGRSKQSRASGNTVGNSTRVAPGCEHTVRKGGCTFEGKGKKGKNSRRLTLHSTPDNGLANSGAHLDDSATDHTQPVTNTTSRQPYLGGFQPSIAVDFPQKYQLTWEKWLEVTKDAYSFWLE